MNVPLHASVCCLYSQIVFHGSECLLADTLLSADWHSTWPGLDLQTGVLSTRVYISWV